MEKQLNIRVSEETYKKLEKYLKDDLMSKQKFFESVIKMYVEGDLVINSKTRMPERVYEQILSFEVEISELQYRVLELKNNNEKVETSLNNMLGELNNKFNSKINELENEIKELKNKSRGLRVNTFPLV